LVAQDPERLARFEREAKTLASLNHPNIAIIHGWERAGGSPALVMELVEGPTLADRIAAKQQSSLRTDQTQSPRSTQSK
jgi:serine/threonine protein kinase